MTRIAHAAKRYWGYPENYIRLWKNELTLTPEFIARTPVFSARCDADIVGLCALEGDGSYPELTHLWVSPGCIGNGVGKALLRHALRTARENGALGLEVASDPHAEGFYRKLGARRIGVVPSRPEGRKLPLLRIPADAVDRV